MGMLKLLRDLTPDDWHSLTCDASCMRPAHIHKIGSAALGILCDMQGQLERLG